MLWRKLGRPPDNEHGQIQLFFSFSFSEIKNRRKTDKYGYGYISGILSQPFISYFVKTKKKKIVGVTFICWINLGTKDKTAKKKNVERPFIGSHSTFYVTSTLFRSSFIGLLPTYC